MENLFEKMETNSKFFMDQMNAAQNLLSGLARYNSDFIIPYLISTRYFSKAELSKFREEFTGKPWNAYLDLLKFNMELMNRSMSSSLEAINDVVKTEFEKYVAAIFNSFSQADGEDLADFFLRHIEMINGVTQALPQSIRDIEPEFGFHFERQENVLFAETDRYRLYRVNPTDPGVTVDEKGKPLVILPPYVLGSNILSFLPKEKKSYAHSFANQGVPTYIRTMKDIDSTPAFQTLTMEDDALDTRYFCEKVMKHHGKKVTLNGYCQGGFSAVCNILSNELDGVVDALITCVSPMDGTRSKGLSGFLESLPGRFNDLLYGTKTLANGNEVADGQLMSWVYKLKSIEDQTPVVAFLRDMFMVARMKKQSSSISKTASALNYWLQQERSDIPMSVTHMSFASYNIPVTEDGTLPVKIFNRKLNFKGIEEKKIPWLLCYGEDDELVEKEVALAPLDYIKVETTPFPKGHVAVATTWSHPESAFALHKRFGPGKKYRGPVRFQLDLNKALDKSESKKVSKPKTASAVKSAAKKSVTAKKRAASSKKQTTEKAKAAPEKK